MITKYSTLAHLKTTYTWIFVVSGLEYLIADATGNVLAGIASFTVWFIAGVAIWEFIIGRRELNARVGLWCKARQEQKQEV